jgi:membrane protease YdiL (CAAX protease family)
VIRNAFVNPATGILRAGWRMAAFVSALAGFTYGDTFLLRSLSPYIPNGLPFFSEIVFYSTLLLTTWMALRFLEGRRLSAVGFPFDVPIWSRMGRGIVMGGGLMTVIFVIEYATGMAAVSLKPLPAVSIAHALWMSFVIFAVGAYGEELLFRGYLFQTLTAGTNRIIAVAAFSVFFALAHLSNPHVTLFSLVNIALAGVWLSVAYYQSGALWYPIGVHFGWNFFQHIYAFPVSGGHFEAFQPAMLVQRGPEWLTGGAFGPEGGALTTVALLVSTLYIFRGRFSGRIVRGDENQ